jgi:amino acid adenylation domain-containing protein
LDRLLPVPPPTHLDSPEGRNHFAADINGDAPDETGFNVEQSIPERFAQIVAEHRSRPAIGAGEWQPSYAELNLAANRLAHALLAPGDAPGDRVALLMRHDGPLIAAILAVLKTGRTVVVLNPTDPPLRLQQILAEAEPGALITDATNRKLTAEIAGENRHVVRFEEHSTGPAHDPEIQIAPTALAYILFTSGSTGRPKGVMQTHRNILHNVVRLSHGLRLRAEDRVAFLASPSGGQGLSTMWCALLNGAALCPFPMAEKGVTGLADWLRERQVTTLILSVSIFRHFIRTLKNGEIFPALRMVRFGSEALTAEDFAAFRKFLPARCILLNSLSSSETGNITQRHFTPDDRVAPGRLPVGGEVTGVEIQLLDEQGYAVAEGETGEIIVRSRFLSPGYWRNESLTAERFSVGQGEVRAFHTGDLGRRAADGSLMFVGRKDARIKIRGYRVEVSEIEDALTHQPEVEGALICVREAPDQDTQLVAYVIPRAGKQCDTETLRRVLRSTLPAHMVPAHFVFLDKFPLTPHGKIDRQALPPPENRPHMDRSSRPRDIVEAHLARIWQPVLGISPIGRDEDFFDLGGTSIQAAEVLARIEQQFGISLSPSSLVEHSTIERLAGLVAGHVIIASPSPLVPLRTTGAGRPLFLVHSGQGDVTCYGLLVRRLPGRPIYGLQSVGLQGESWPLMSIQAMARRYLTEVIAQDPTGPYLLGATCMGGMVAFEMAHMLVREGRKVALLALLDVGYPLPKWRQHNWHERLYGSVRDPVRDAFRMLRWAVIRATGLGRSQHALVAYRRFVSHMNSRANRRYQPELFAGAITVFRTLDQKFPREDLRLLMCDCAQAATVIPLPGNRSGLFVPPTVDELARQLQKALAVAEGKETP